MVSPVWSHLIELALVECAIQTVQVLMVLELVATQVIAPVGADVLLDHALRYLSALLGFTLIHYLIVSIKKI